MLFFVLLTVLILIILVVCFGFFCLAFLRHDNPEIIDANSFENDFLDNYRPVVEKGIQYIKAFPKKEIYIKSFDGIKLYGEYFDNKSDRTMILFHGYRSVAYRDFSCAVKMYCDLGLNVLLVDQRSHFKSGGKLITFGVKEQKDVVSWIEYYLSNINANSKIFLGGMSMGATTVLLASGQELPQNVKGIVADCGFTSPVDIIKRVAHRNFKINASLVLPIMNLYCLLFGRFSIYNVSTVASLKKTKIPVLFIHGKDDKFVPPEMSDEGYKNTVSEKEILLVDNAGHGMSYLFDSELVFGKIKNFLEKYY